MIIVVSTSLLCAGSPTSRPGCPEPRPAWPWVPPGMGHPQPPWAPCSSVSPPCNLHCWIYCLPNLCRLFPQQRCSVTVNMWQVDCVSEFWNNFELLNHFVEWNCGFLFWTDSWIENDNLSVDKNVDDQADSSSIRSRGSLHSTASGEHKGLPMPRLQSFSSGQVFNCSTGMQILVIPSKDDHVLEVNITWQLGIRTRKNKQKTLETGYESTLKDYDLISLCCNILTLRKPMALNIYWPWKHQTIVSI